MKGYVSFILIFFFISCSLNKIPEKEPNNSKWESQVISIPVNLTGWINNTDIDFYKLIIQDPNTNLIDIELSTHIPNPLELNFYFQNKLIKSAYLSSNDYEPREKRITFKNIAIQQGVYYIKVNKNIMEYGEIKYNLNIKPLSDGKDIEKEPNDRLVEANYLNITNGYIKGFFNPAENFTLKEDNYLESDWYRFNITEKSNILSIEITSIPGIDPVIELYNSLGFLIKQADSMSIDEPEILKNFGISQEGEHFIKIYSKPQGSQNDKIPYQLYLNLRKNDPSFEFEPNDSMNQANYVQQNIKGYINPRADIDWYTFDITEEKASLNISITPLNSVDMKIALYNNIGEKLYVIDGYPVNEAEILPNLLLNKGKYYLTVSDKSNKNQNYLDYYTLTIKQTAYKTNWEYEPNNSFIQAMNIIPNNSYEGYLSPRGDMDYFCLNIPQENNLKINLSPVPDIDFIIQVFDDKSNMIQEIDKRKTNEGETAVLSLAPGIYYIILKDAENKSNFYEKYIFSIFER